MFSNIVGSKSYRLIMVVMVLAITALQAFAQVAIVVDTDTIFTEANTWIAVFTPIVAIGIGIAIALAILKFIGAQIVSAFKG
jgi:hypothetical protein